VRRPVRVRSPFSACDPEYCHTTHTHTHTHSRARALTHTHMRPRGHTHTHTHMRPRGPRECVCAFPPSHAAAAAAAAAAVMLKTALPAPREGGTRVTTYTSHNTAAFLAPVAAASYLVPPSSLSRCARKEAERR
jgi:hypothetical protein